MRKTTTLRPTSSARVFFIKIHKCIASSPFRSLRNVKRLVVGRTFRLLLLFSIYLPCNFLPYSFHYLFWSGTWSVVCRPVRIVLTKCWKVAHWTVKKLLKGWQKYKRLLPKFQKMLHFFFMFYINVIKHYRR